jgi:hypothetical protein
MWEKIFKKYLTDMGKYTENIRNIRKIYGIYGKYTEYTEIYGIYGKYTDRIISPPATLHHTTLLHCSTFLP